MTITINISLRTIDNNLEKIWKGIKEIINIKSNNYNQPTFIIHNDKTLTDPIEIANSYNYYFTSIADKIQKERKYDGNKHHCD